MEENNNNQPVSLETPVTPIAPEAPVMPEAPVAPVAPEADHMEVHPVPSLVIEDPAAPEAPVMPEAPVAPVMPEAPVAPTEPVAPVVPEAPVTPETPVTPAPEAAPAAPTADGTEAPAKKKSNIVPIIIILLCIVAGAAIVYFRNKPSNPTPTPTPNPNGGEVTPTPEPTPGEDVSTLSLNQASLNGVTFNFPETKTTFSNVGWTWDANYASNDVEAGTTTNGGRIGNAPGGAVVQVINKGTETAHIEDCTIYSATFYNPKDGSENVTFVGGLGYTSNLDAVKAKMTELGYTKVTETPNENAVSLRYFLNNDTTNYGYEIEYALGYDPKNDDLKEVCTDNREKKRSYRKRESRV